MTTLPQFRKFDINEEPTSLGIRWKAWLVEFENLLLALNIADKKRQRALMFYYAGKDIHDIYRTLITDEEANEDFGNAKKRITDYLEPKVNKTYEIYHFRCMKQGHPDNTLVKADESIDAFVTRLRKKASRCDFQDSDTEVRYQIIFGCASKKLRKEALKKDNMTLDEVIDLGRMHEVVEKQARSMEDTEKTEEVNAIRSSGKYSQRRRMKDALDDEKGRAGGSGERKCYSCGGGFPHNGGRKSCPALGKKCHKCGMLNHLATVCRGKAVRQLKCKRKDADLGSSEDEYVYESRDRDDASSSGSDLYVKAVERRDKAGCSKAQVQLNVENVPIRVDIDTGASCNLMDEHDFEKIKALVKLKKTKAKIYPYNSANPLAIKGQFSGIVETKRRLMSVKFYVVSGKKRLGTILGLQASEDLGVVKLIKKIDGKKDDRKIDCDNPGVTKMVRGYDEIFKGIGKMKGVKVKLDIDHSVEPKAQKHRRIPFHLREKVDAELERLAKAGVIEKVDEATGWVSPIVVENKPNGEVRVCVDMTEPNKAIRRVHHVIPTVDDLKYKINGAKVFSKIDLRKGYHQLELDMESRNIS